MNILHISNHDRIATGDVAYKLHKKLERFGHNSLMLVRHKDVNEDVVQIKKKFPYFFNKSIWMIKRIIHKVIKSNNKIIYNPKYHYYNRYERTNLFSTKDILRQVPFKPDIIILYWVSQTINSKNIYELSLLTKAPILWYLMDMAALTGGCHYAWDCDGYKNDCANCPALYSSNKYNTSFKNLQFKKRHFSLTNLTAVVGSEWLYKQAKESSLFKDKNIYKIMAGKDVTIFRPFDKQLAKNKLDISIDKKVIFFGSVNLGQERKGMSILLLALRHLKTLLSKDNKENDVILLIAGNNQECLFKEFPFNYKYIGRLNNNKELALAYQASEIFVCPSIEDSGPLMINESIMCGTPVVSFEMGVALDLVLNGVTGYRAKLKDCEDFAQGMFKLLNLNDKAYRKVSNNCRELGLKLCHPSKQLSAFEKLIKKLTVST